jgi:hypothetical protein
VALFLIVFAKISREMNGVVQCGWMVLKSEVLRTCGKKCAMTNVSALALMGG